MSTVRDRASGLRDAGTGWSAQALRWACYVALVLAFLWLLPD